MTRNSTVFATYIAYSNMLLHILRSAYSNIFPHIPIYTYMYIYIYIYPRIFLYILYILLYFSAYSNIVTHIPTYSHIVPHIAHIFPDIRTLSCIFHCMLTYNHLFLQNVAYSHRSQHIHSFFTYSQVFPHVWTFPGHGPICKSKCPPTVNALYFVVSLFISTARLFVMAPTLLCRTGHCAWLAMR